MLSSEACAIVERRKGAEVRSCSRIIVQFGCRLGQADLKSDPQDYMTPLLSGHWG